MDETAPVPQENSQSLWSDIKESIRGSHRNYTTGPIGRSILLLAIPMVLEMIMESVFAVVDIYWVSHLEGDIAMLGGVQLHPDGAPEHDDAAVEGEVDGYDHGVVAGHHGEASEPLRRHESHALVAVEDLRGHRVLWSVARRLLPCPCSCRREGW